MLDEDALYTAISSVWALAYMNACERHDEEHGTSLMPRGPVQIEDWAPSLPRETLLPFAWYLIGRTQQAWGASVGLVFHHAGITGEDMGDALTDLFLGIQGHGVSLRDDFAEAIARAESALGRFSPEHAVFQLVPFQDSMDWLDELAAVRIELEVGRIQQGRDTADGFGNLLPADQRE